jgi:radical SAM superfamily enzyme YgiQ (UPF0313 family)
MNKVLNKPSRAMRPAKNSSKNVHKYRATNKTGKNILLIDLNNFANFPTMAIGILVASLRNSGHSVKVVCPLAYGAPAAEREWRETPLDHIARRINLSTQQPFLILRDAARRTRIWWKNRPNRIVLRETHRAISEDTDIVLLSAYLQHRPTVFKIGKIVKRHQVPLLVGGAMFNIKETANTWLSVPGLSALFGGEADKSISDLVHAVCANADLMQFPGVTLPDGQKSSGAPPLRNLDATSIPDFTDFPWDRYPAKIIPVMTGRGCQWDKCVFCSDVVSVSGRTFRTRSIENVMLELREQSRRHHASNFLFLDLKLNSNPNMFRGISEQIQTYVPGAEWIGTVHVDLRKDNGLSRRDLKAATSSGMRRISFGLECGSQNMLDAMLKGSTVGKNSEFIRNAYDAGLSIRCTMFMGFPGETPEDLEKTADFLEEHAKYLDRVRFNAFSIMEDTPIYDALRKRSPEYSAIQLTRLDHKIARAEYKHPSLGTRAYLKAKKRTLSIVYAINRKRVRVTAQAFDGLM